MCDFLRRMSRREVRVVEILTNFSSSQAEDTGLSKVLFGSGVQLSSSQHKPPVVWVSGPSAVATPLAAELASSMRTILVSPSKVVPFLLLPHPPSPLHPLFPALLPSSTLPPSSLLTFSPPSSPSLRLSPSPPPLSLPSPLAPNPPSPPSAFLPSSSNHLHLSSSQPFLLIHSLSRPHEPP